MNQHGTLYLQFCFVQTRYYASAGVSTILTLPELYFRPATSEELVDYVALVANEAKNLPILYYHYPKKSNVNSEYSKFLVVTKILNIMVVNIGAVTVYNENLNENDFVIIAFGYS